jgi:hypothetical protein
VKQVTLANQTIGMKSIAFAEATAPKEPETPTTDHDNH